MAEPGELPVIAPPVVTAGEPYVVELTRWAIPNNGTDSLATTDGLQAAIDWAAEQGLSHVIVPAGEYLIGKEGNAVYRAGLEVPSNMIFELESNATLRMETNDKWNYCVISVNGVSDVVLRGGRIIGDRDTHVFTDGGAHDEGHAICIEGNSERVAVVDMELSYVTGDGILIVGSGDAGNSAFDISVQGNDIHHNRRQGVSIVGGVRVLIEDNTIHHISGTSPQFGIDVESLSFRSADILIRNNQFNQNQGGDLVNTDGTNLWFLDNVLDQTGLEERQTDGPIVHWGKSDQVVRGNTITVTVGSSNGRWGLIGYSRDDPDREGYGTRGDNVQPNYFQDNTFIGGGLHMARTESFVVDGNTFIDGATMLGYKIDCLRLTDNDVNGVDVTQKYKFRDVGGEASNNRADGEPVDFLMSDDAPFTNSPPSQW